MDVRISAEATDEEANAIASAISRHVSGVERVAVYVGDNDEPATVIGAHDTGDTPRRELDMTDREAALFASIADVHRGGPERYRERLADIGKLFVRDRLDLWFEDGILFEDGTFAEYDADDRLPADGLITGAGEFEGRSVHFMANDYTVKAGSMAAKGVEKFLRMQERALEDSQPILYLMDSSGGRIDQQRAFFANREGIGKFYFNHSMLSGFVPQICVLYGPCIAGAAYTPVFADFTVMVEGMSAMAIASPRMVEMVTGEQIDLADLGGPMVHARYSGSADLIARDEEHARKLVAKLIGYLPDCAGQDPPCEPARSPGQSPAELDHVIPIEPNQAYDMTAVIERIVDEGSWLELQPEYGSEILTGFARLGGRPCGIIANQPNARAGAIFPDSAEKAASFIWTCDAYGIPLLYLCDTPGFMAGSQVERDGILEKGKKMIYATSSATVPKICVVVRKAYGAGIYAMSGPAYRPQATLALPSGEIAIMGPEAAIRAVFANKLDEIEDPDEREKEEQRLREEYRDDIDVMRMASEAIIDEIVPPSRLRDELRHRFTFYQDAAPDRPNKKHGTVL